MAQLFTPRMDIFRKDLVLKCMNPLSGLSAGAYLESTLLTGWAHLN